MVSIMHSRVVHTFSYCQRTSDRCQGHTGGRHPSIYRRSPLRMGVWMWRWTDGMVVQEESSKHFELVVGLDRLDGSNKGFVVT
jgi:hypothetical protein